MADSLSTDGRFSAAPRKAPKPSMSGAWIVMLLSGLVAAVAFFYVTNTANQKYSVLVASKDIPAGTAVNNDYFVQTEIAAEKQTLSRFVRLRDRESVRGQIANSFIARGDIVQRSSFRPPATREISKGEMSIPVEKKKAANGRVFPGDLIDVLDERAPASPVAQNLEVLYVSNDNGSLGGGGSFSISVAVDSQQQLAIAKALDGNKINIVRKTGMSR